MLNNKPLAVNELRQSIDETLFDFTTTADVSPLSGVIGQSRGTKVMQFGLQVNKPGYNIYVAGISGTGKTSFTKAIIKDISKEKVELYDWCYVNRFSNPSKPKALKLPLGMGRKLKKDMETLIAELKIDIPKAFNDDHYQKEKQAIGQTFNKRTNKIYQHLNDIAQEHGFIIRPSASGLLTVPAVDGEPMNEEAYRSLSKESVEKINAENEKLQTKTLPYTNELRQIEKETKEAIHDLDEKIAHSVVHYHIADLLINYKTCPPVVDYLQTIEHEVVKNKQDFFYHQSKDQDDEQLTMQQANNLKQMKDRLFTKYKVNLLIDHEKTIGAPVVFADNPTFYHLIGRVEYENQLGTMQTDFTKIKPGFLHEANGGYIIIQAKDILANTFAWESLKRSLLNEKIAIENIAEQTNLVATSTVTPDPIPLHIKVIIVGSLDVYQLLYHHDEDFRKLFKIKVDFDIEMHATTENMMNLARFIHTHCAAYDLLPFHRSALARLIEYSIRLAGQQNKLSTKFNEQVDIIYEAHTWATIEQQTVVTSEHIQQAINEKNKRNNLYEEKYRQQIANQTILIDTNNDVIGQVNGLAVSQLGQYRFGKPIKITASTFIGKEGIINIERESDMSGSIHNKGMYILAGYLGQQFAQSHPLRLTAHIAFEQSYGPVDGDSASSTELYAILSSLAEVPIHQGIAVTGSVNQKGEIQPIGGVNEKIEGFFDICKGRGLTGKQGVIIPKQNIQHLMLNQDVIDAVTNKQFSIYGIETIAEGIEILTNTIAGLSDHKNEFEKGSIFAKVANKLKQYAQHTDK